MAILVKNTATGETIRVSGIKLNGSIVIPKKDNMGQRFITTHAAYLSVNYAADGRQYFTINEGYELVRGRAPRTEKPADVPAEQPADVPTEQPVEQPAAMEEVVEAADVVEVPAEQPAVVPAEPKVEAKPQTDGLQDALSLAFAPVFAKVAKDIEENVRAKVQAEIDELKAQAKVQATRLEIVKPDGEKYEVEGLFCDEFEDMVQDVNNGWSPYLWGAAGCGKSHTCEQIAKALGLPYYTQNMLNFSHEIAGYGNAAGEFVATPFFHAFSEGGLFHLDEADRSQIEGLVTLNQALQQGVFNFPVIGNVKAHPNFRFICSGNTQMNGADELYTSGQTQDASFKRRVIFYEMHYDRRIELPIMAQGDEVLVNFVEDVRRAIKKTGTLHFVSYTETKYMKQHEDKKEKALVRSTFKSLDIDIIRQIYGALEDTDNPWARALYNVSRGRI